MCAALVAAIENLLHLQVDLLCKAIPLSLTRLPLSVSHSAWISRREREWREVVTNRELVLLLLLIKTACGSFYSTRRCCCHFPICTFISMPVDNFHLAPIPLRPCLFSPPSPPPTTSQHVLEPSEPQLLTN